ncbi:MAG: hypothetical protein V3W44_05155 [Dehalococcoidales bacterium]
MPPSKSTGKYGEPWGRGYIDHDAVCYDGGNGTVLFRSNGTFMSADKVDRIIACVNAMEGTEDPERFVSDARAAAQPVERGPRLCYVSRHIAYFTTQKISEQWGDDWNDAPYEHNAGVPYTYLFQNDSDKAPWFITWCYWAGPFKTPDNDSSNSQFSVQDINNGQIPWLRSRKRGLMADTKYEIFKEAIEAEDGAVGPLHGQDDSEWP